MFFYPGVNRPTVAHGTENDWEMSASPERTCQV